jgi:hypothetical protein
MSTLPDLTPDQAQAVVEDYKNGSSADHKIEVAPPPEPDLSEVTGEDEDEDPEEAGEKQEKPRQIDQLVRLVESKAKMFHAPALSRYDFYADILEGDARQTHSIGSSALNRRMMRWYRGQHGKALGQSVIDGANGALRALAEAGPSREVAVRTAEHGGKHYIDLADETWRAIEVSADGWKLVKAPPVRFRRASAMAPLCKPRQGNAGIDILRDSLNTKDDDSFIMVVAWLLAALRPVGPYPILVINGEQGSAKSTMTKILRSLVDPSTAPLRHASASDRDLFITAMHSWVLAFDNCSRMPGWLSDALCRLATGGGFCTRALYTDTDEVVFNSKRPIILNGITEFVERGDLADRSVFVHLSPIAKTERKTEREVMGEFEMVRPIILGALLDAMSTGLRELPNVKLPSKPRMAEFAEWATACEGDFTVNEGDFLEAYERNQAVAVAHVVESDPVAAAIQTLSYELGAKDETFEGSATQLLTRINAITDEETRKDRSWPKSAKALGRAVARVAPALRQSGIPIKRAHRTAYTRTIIIEGALRPQMKDHSA